MSFYDSLRSYLLGNGGELIELKFSDIENLIKRDLPQSAYLYSNWWANGGHSQSCAWMDAGYRVENVDFEKGIVKFEKKGTVSQTGNILSKISRLAGALNLRIARRNRKMNLEKKSSVVLNNGFSGADNVPQRVLFCKVAYMKDYKGLKSNDMPMNGGSYVKDTLNAWEKYNFYPVLNEYNELVCYGFVETKHLQRGLGERKQLHIENIAGCEAFNKKESVDNVLVVWCALNENNELRIVGWYNNATVYRHYQQFPKHVKNLFDTKDRQSAHLVDCPANLEPIYVGGYFIVAKASDVVLLPDEERDERWKWYSARKDGFGFGQSLVWYGKKNREDSFVVPEVKDLIRKINDYL